MVVTRSLVLGVGQGVDAGDGNDDEIKFRLHDGSEVGFYGGSLCGLNDDQLVGSFLYESLE